MKIIGAINSNIAYVLSALDCFKSAILAISIYL